MNAIDQYQKQKSKVLSAQIAALKTIADALYHQALAADDMDDFDNRDDIQWACDKISEAIDTLSIRV